MAHASNFFRKKHTNDIKNAVIRARDENKKCRRKIRKKKNMIFFLKQKIEMTPIHQAFVDLII